MTTMDPKTIFLDAYRFFAMNLRRIAVICLPFLFLSVVIKHTLIRNVDAATMTPLGLFLPAAVKLIFYPIYTGALILLMGKQARQEDTTPRTLVISAFNVFIPFFLLGVLEIFLTAVGFALFILPGLIITARLAFCEYFLVLYGLGPFEAIQQSIRATKQHFWLLFSVVVPFWLVGYIAEQALRSIQSDPLRIAADVTVSFFFLFMDVVLFRIFMEAVMDASDYP